MKSLKDTALLMQSEEYKDRFIAEYWQTKIRFEKLKALINQLDAEEQTQYDGKKVTAPKHDCPGSMLRDQRETMGVYLHILEVRAVIEGIDLGGEYE